MKIHLIAAARPNFMKIAPLYHALTKEKWANPVIVHTGQHYDINMSDAFFQDLKLPNPHIHMGIGSGSHAEQAGNVMIAYEKILQREQPSVIVVVGDVNSTMACTIAASKTFYSSSESDNLDKSRPVIAHLEAGLRSNDRTMPEEINRLVTDVLADVLWTPSEDAVENLLGEGISREKIVNVGNIMIDSFEMLRKIIRTESIYTEFGLNRGQYGLITLHRPSNVDSKYKLASLCQQIVCAADKTPFIFPVHPRTKKNLENFGLINMLKSEKNIILTEPMNYIRFMSLIYNCRLAITDSGGLQEETTYLGIPCLTVRPNTERPITVTLGTNKLCPIEKLQQRIEEIVSGPPTSHSVPPLWDGHTAERIVDSIKALS